MYKLISFAALLAVAHAGAIHGVVAPAAVHHSVAVAHPVAAVATSYAAGPALGATLLGRVHHEPAQVTVVKQPITVQQPEIRYKNVPTVVGINQPTVHHTIHQTVAAPPAVVHHAPAVVHQAAVVHHAPAAVHHAPAAVHHAPAAVHHASALTYAAAPAVVGHHGLAYSGHHGLVAPGLLGLSHHGLPASTLVHA